MRLEKFKELTDILGFTPQLDGLVMALTNEISIDIIRLDDMFRQRDNEYNPDKCTYKGKEGYSMMKYVSEKYGDRATELMKLLMKSSKRV